MDTKIIKKLDKEIDEVIEELKQNRCVILPTETVYGIGGNALSIPAVENIFILKERARTNPLNVLVSDFSMVECVAKNITAEEEKIMNAFWPGPLTIILPKKETVPSIVTAGGEYIGVRIPNCEKTRTIIRKANIPLACPSANISGKPSGTMVEDIQKEFDGKVKYIVDDGISSLGIESTVLRVINKEAVILRPGFVTKEDIEKLGIKARYDKNIFKKVEKNEKVLSEGMKNKHYVPSIKCILAKKDNRNIQDVILDKVEKEKDKKIIIISCKENIEKYKKENIVEVINMGSENNITEIGKNIFHILRSLEFKNADLVIIEGIKEEDNTIAIINRLVRACEYNVI